MGEADTSIAIKNIQDMESTWQVINKILWFVTSPSKADWLDRLNAQSEWGIKELVEPVLTNKPLTDNSPNQTDGEGRVILTKLIFKYFYASKSYISII